MVKKIPSSFLKKKKHTIKLSDPFVESNNLRIVNLEKIKKEVGSNVLVVAVSKTKPVACIKKAYETGHRDFGENKIQEMTSKFNDLPKDINSGKKNTRNFFFKNLHKIGYRYFSPNNPMAPLSKAFFIGTFLFSSKSIAFSILELTKFSTATISFRSSFEK